jgi:beta-carotene 3-hydroxylase
MQEALLVLCAFIAMEPVTYLAHRHIFHGFGFPIHKSHHGERRGVFEKNDFYPGVSALVTMAIIALGVFVAPLAFLIPVGFGMTVYGVLYFFIHDLVIHLRVPALRPLRRRFHWHHRAHRAHHRFGGEPYGLLFPILPRRARRSRLAA